jgi:nicotinamidase-related amidase
MEPSMPLHLEPHRTALVVVDPQNWLLAGPLAPHSGEIVARNCARLACALRPAGPVILVRVAFSDGYAEMLRTPVDVGPQIPETAMSSEQLAFHPLVLEAGHDVIITKRQWSAFYGTELDLQLRRRGMSTIVLAGATTNFGVESTARDARQNNYALIVAEDACAGIDADMHAFSITKILPRLARVRATSDVVAALDRQTARETSR